MRCILVMIFLLFPILSYSAAKKEGASEVDKEVARQIGMRIGQRSEQEKEAKNMILSTFKLPTSYISKVTGLNKEGIMEIKRKLKSKL